MIPNIIKGTGITGAIRYNMGEGNDKETRLRKELAPGASSRSEILGGQNFGFEVNSAERVAKMRQGLFAHVVVVGRDAKSVARGDD